MSGDGDGDAADEEGDTGDGCSQATLLVLCSPAHALLFMVLGFPFLWRLVRRPRYSIFYIFIHRDGVWWWWGQWGTA